MWNWQGFFDYFTNAYLLWGAVTTVWLTVASIAGGLVLGLVLALMRISSRTWLTVPAQAYLWIFRGTPLLVQLIIIYTGLPQLGIRFNVVQSALLGLVLNEAAYLSEIIRSGIQSVGRGQTDAAKSLGMTYLKVMRLIVLPQAIRIIIPPLGNSVNGVLKTTSVTSVISMEELLRRTQILIQEKFMVLELFMVAAIWYLAMTTLWDIAQRRLEKRYGKGYDFDAKADRR